MTECWITPKDAAAILDISRQRLHQLIHGGKLEAVSEYRPVVPRKGTRLARRREWLVSLASVEARKLALDSGHAIP